MAKFLAILMALDILATKETRERTAFMRAAAWIIGDAVATLFVKLLCLDGKYPEDSESGSQPPAPLVLFETTTLGALLGSIPLAVQLNEGKLMALAIINISALIAVVLQMTVLRDTNTKGVHSLSRHSRRLAGTVLVITILVWLGLNGYYLVARQLPFSRSYSRAEFSPHPESLEFEFKQANDRWGGMITTWISPETFGSSEIPPLVQVEAVFPPALEGKLRLGPKNGAYVEKTGKPHLDSVFLAFTKDRNGYYAGIRLKKAAPERHRILLSVRLADDAEPPDDFPRLEEGHVQVRYSLFAESR